MDILMNGMAMILGNAKDEGLLITHVLLHKLGDKMLRSFLSFIVEKSEPDEE